MSHAPDNPGYFDTIQMYFLEATGRGIMFGGRDLELLSRWRDEGASASIVCRGIERAIESMPDDDPPRDVYACRAWVEAELESARERSAGARTDESASPRSEENHPRQPAIQTSIFEEALANVERAGKACDDESRRRVYREAWRELNDLVEGGAVDDPFAELAAIEDALVDGYLRALDRAERERIEEAIADKNRADLAIMSPEARREHLAARRRRLLIEEYDMVPLIE
ncbi:MAG: hypothetical protein ACOCV2_07210 [Persicimonas sp.]